MSITKIQRITLISFKTNYISNHTPLLSSFSTTAQPDKQILADETSPKKSGSVASFLKESGFSDTLLAKIEKTRPKLLTSKLEQTIKPKINFFQNMGLSATQIADVVSADPRILTRVSIQFIERSVTVLKKVLGDKMYDSRILKNFGWFLNYDLDKTLVPNVEFMRSCGIEQSQILQLFYNYPRFLLHKEENFKEFVRRVDEMGVDRESKLFVYAVRPVGSMSLESWEQKLEVFRGLGYTEVDIISTFRKFPNVFALSERKIKETAEFLLSSGRFDSSYIFRYPYVLIFSLDGRLKPRLRVLEILEREKILKFKPTTTVFSISDSKFFAKFVRPHLDKVKDLSFLVSDAEI
ncbi:transcription termination factor MTERF8, chloroplastic [Artemisia annua]|uniref:Transcription termination factor MTERF8, chloroplastic n=1 Tax=Artemisia annua TaxID=35608 RepID=A0A2U1KXA9_ARTAN|nr:transcription termination factor MTERF8, chloroplastic [Artemisia annua]